MDAVALALPCVTSNYAEICTGNGKDGAAVLGVGVELALLGACKRAVWHDCVL